MCFEIHDLPSPYNPVALFSSHNTPFSTWSMSVMMRPALLKTLISRPPSKLEAGGFAACGAGLGFARDGGVGFAGVASVVAGLLPLNVARDFVAHKKRYGIIGRRSRLPRGSRYGYLLSGVLWFEPLHCRSRVHAGRFHQCDFHERPRRIQWPLWRCRREWTMGLLRRRALRYVV
jgi:hypothetical protein